MHSISPDKFPRRCEINERRHGAHLHHELIGLPDRFLPDIGINLRTADYPLAKPFWMM